jgi:tetratricopeptide (TPR) repeat protein
MLATLPILAILATALPNVDPHDFDKLIEKGKASFLSYDLNSAEKAYAEACPAELAGSLPLNETGFCEHGLGVISDLRGNSEEAARHYIKALSNWEALGEDYRRHRIRTLTSLGGTYRRQGRVQDAERVLSQAFALAKPLAQSDPELYATVLSRWGALDSEPNAARTRLNEAIEVLRAQKPPNARELAVAYDTLGVLDLTMGHYKAGESNLRLAMELGGASLGEDHPEAAAYAANLALALLAEGEFNRAETLLRRARFVIESRAAPGSLQLVNVLTGLTSVDTALGKFSAAEESGQKAVAILREHAANSGSGNRAAIALVEVSLGALYLREGKTAEADAILTPAVDEERRLFQSGRKLGDGIRMLALLRTQQQAWSQAESLYREALGIYEAALGPNHPDIAQVLHEYAAVLKHQRAPRDKVRSIEARARAIDRTGSRA